MFKKTFIFFLFLTAPAFAGNTLDAGITFDYDINSSEIQRIKENLPKIEKDFIDLKYTVNFKPLNLLGEEDYKVKNNRKNSSYISPNYKTAPSSYEISLSTGKLTGEVQTSDKLQYLAQKNPNNREILFAYAIQLKVEGKLNEALKIADMAVESDPDYALSHFLRGDILRRLERYKDACYEYIYTTQINPYCADAYFNIAKILELLNDKELALDYYRIAYKINPEDKEIREIIINGYSDL